MLVGNNNNESNLYKYIMIGMYVGVFGGILALFPPALGGDAQIFLETSVYAAPVYPMLIKLLMALFGTGMFLNALSVIQCALACAACIVLFIRLDKLVFCNKLLSLVSAIALLSPFIMTPILSRKHLVLTKTVMLEALTLPGYYIFIFFIIGLICNEIRQSDLIGALCTSFVLMLTRGQMMLTVIVIIAVCGAQLIVKKQWKKWLLIALLSIVLLVFANIGQRLYNLHYNGHFTGTAQGAQTVMTNYLYIADRDDGEYIADEDARQIFYIVYDNADEQEHLYKFATGSSLSRARHYEDSHDAIKLDCLEGVIDQVYEGRNGDTYAERIMNRDEVASRISAGLKGRHIDRYLSKWMCSALMGLVRAVSVEQHGLWLWAILMYLINLGLMIYLIRKNGLTSAVKLAICFDALILLFVVSTSMIIMCLSRYMIYNLSLFYVGTLAMMDELFGERAKTRK